MKRILLTPLLFIILAAQAHALDCGKAKTTIEKAICADPSLAQADEDMSKAYADLRASMPDKDEKMLAQSQRNWITLRENICSPNEGADLAKCISERTSERTMFLRGEPESGPGAPWPLRPFFIVRKPKTKNYYDVDYALTKFVAPGSAGGKLFNAQVDAIAREAPTGPSEGGNPNAQLQSTASMAVAYASPRLISASVDLWSYDGGAHGNGGVTNINVDLEKAKIIEAGDIFPESAAPKLKEDCVAQIHKQKVEKWEGQTYNQADDPNYQADEIPKHLAAIDRWTFAADKATVTFDPYAIGSYAEGPFTCEFPMTMLRKLAKPEAPLPQ